MRQMTLTTQRNRGYSFLMLLLVLIVGVSANLVVRRVTGHP
jgi:hypothetical protein